jgi:hypothetical protein
VILPGVNITAIVPPAVGWPIVTHCSLCRKTVIVLSPWAAKPADGDIWLMQSCCMDPATAYRHAVEMAASAPVMQVSAATIE